MSPLWWHRTRRVSLVGIGVLLAPRRGRSTSRPDVVSAAVLEIVAMRRGQHTSAGGS